MKKKSRNPTQRKICVSVYFTQDEYRKLTEDIPEGSKISTYVMSLINKQLLTNFKKEVNKKYGKKQSRKK